MAARELFTVGRLSDSRKYRARQCQTEYKDTRNISGEMFHAWSRLTEAEKQAIVTAGHERCRGSPRRFHPEGAGAGGANHSACVHSRSNDVPGDAVCIPPDEAPGCGAPSEWNWRWQRPPQSFFSFAQRLNQKLDVGLRVFHTVERVCTGCVMGRVIGITQIFWRRGRDLNPRYPLRYVRFRGGSFQPLTHLSGKQSSVVGLQSSGKLVGR